MLVKALVQEVISPHLVKVRIPSINKIEGVNGATPNNELSTASVCSLPNIITDVHPGDIVVLGFENDNISNPIVIGHLSIKGESKSITNIKCDELVALGDVSLGKHTSIGDITPKNIECLRNQTSNINDTFQVMTKSIEEIRGQLDALNGSNVADSITKDALTSQNTLTSHRYYKYATTSGEVDVSNVGVVQLGNDVTITSISVDDVQDMSTIQEVTFMARGTRATIQNGNGIHLYDGKDCPLRQFDTITLIRCGISPSDSIWVEKCRCVSTT